MKISFAFGIITLVLTLINSKGVYLPITPVQDKGLPVVPVQAKYPGFPVTDPVYGVKNPVPLPGFPVTYPGNVQSPVPLPQPIDTPACTDPADPRCAGLSAGNAAFLRSPSRSASATTVASAYWKSCADQGFSCGLPASTSRTFVAYGHGCDNYYYKIFGASGSNTFVPCTDAYFNDPRKNFAKHCNYVTANLYVGVDENYYICNNYSDLAIVGYGRTAAPIDNTNYFWAPLRYGNCLPCNAAEFLPSGSNAGTGQKRCIIGYVPYDCPVNSSGV